MRITALVKIANECEIIESFIRYNFNIVDSMTIVSSCCVDNTLIILRKLIKEGYDIDLIEETEIAFEERYIDNKYLKRIADKGDSDLVVPLDADEFIGGDGNPRDILEKLNLDRIYIVNWKNYAIREQDDFDEPFIPKRLTYVKKNYSGNDITKVIIPTALIDKNEIIMSAGRHSAVGKSVIQERLSSIRICHFPVINIEQYKQRLYEDGIKHIISHTRGNSDASHKYRQLELLNNGEDFFEIANDYGLGIEENAKLELEYDPLDVSFCEPETLEMKYTDLIKVDAFEGVFKTGQLMALKAYNLERDKEDDRDKKTILIFGTGVGVGKLFNGCPENIVNIRAYIDNDPVKQFRIYNKRIVIPPEYIRFFNYDKIIISSDRYFDEMQQELIELGVADEMIGTAGYLFDLLEELRK